MDPSKLSGGMLSNSISFHIGTDGLILILGCMFSGNNVSSRNRIYSILTSSLCGIECIADKLSLLGQTSILILCCQTHDKTTIPCLTSTEKLAEITDFMSH